MFALYRERLLDMRTRLSNELRWQLHDLWPELELPAKALAQSGWQTKVASRLAHAEQTTQVLIARDAIRRIRELTRPPKTCTTSSPRWSGRSRRSYLPNSGSVSSWPPSSSASPRHRPVHLDAQLARLAGCAPIPASSGRSDRYRLDPGGNRRLNSAFYMLAIIRIAHDPRTAVYLQKQRANGKTKREAIRNLKRHLVRRVYHLLHDPNSISTTICLT